MANEIPQWAKERACALANIEPTKPDSFVWTPDRIGTGGLASAFARYIMEHEKPPVDPLASELADAMNYSVDRLGLFQADEAASLIAELRCRGIELGKAGEA